MLQGHEDLGRLSGRLIDKGGRSTSSSGSGVPYVKLEVSSVQKQSVVHNLQFHFTPEDRCAHDTDIPPVLAAKLTLALREAHLFMMSSAPSFAMPDAF